VLFGTWITAERTDENMSGQWFSLNPGGECHPKHPQEQSLKIKNPALHLFGVAGLLYAVGHFCSFSGYKRENGSTSRISDKGYVPFSCNRGLYTW